MSAVADDVPRSAPRRRASAPIAKKAAIATTTAATAASHGPARRICPFITELGHERSTGFYTIDSKPRPGSRRYQRPRTVVEEIVGPALRLVASPPLDAVDVGARAGC